MNKEACVRLLMCAYYAMFYAAQAALLHLDLQFRKHSAVISAFNKELIKSGVLSVSLSKSLQKSHRLRLKSDYGLVPVPEEVVVAVIEETDNFISAVREHLLKQGYVLDEK
jgi:uncharacterized protein (UPF0332 family)